MRRACILLMLLSASVLQIPAAGTADAQADRIAAWLDYACYDYPPEEGMTLVEFYYAILRHEMTFAYVDAAFVAKAQVWIEITGEDSVVVDTLSKLVATAVRSAEEIARQHIRITDQMSVALRPGTYVARLMIEDVESRTDGSPMTGKAGRRAVSIVVPDFSADDLVMSGIELAYKIEVLPIEMKESDERSIDKSNRRIVPNPSRVFVDTDSTMYFYGEVYNLEFGAEMSREFQVACQILDTHGAVVSDYGKRNHFKPGTSAIVSSSLDIYDLPEGIYYINLEVTDAETGRTATGSKPFQLLSGKMEKAPDTTAEALTEADVEYLQKVVKYHLTGEQKSTLEGLSFEGKIRFFEDFWRNSDPDPSTRLNEFKVELFRRFHYANEHYSLSMVRRDDGWQTDRGRVYMVYGAPDEIETYPWTPDLKPFEKWNYFNIGSQGAKFFIFQDDTGYGDYRLAHSNANGEPFDPEWDELLQRGHLLNY